ncbi:helix-turn-helix domain-containing protein [Aquimarina algicola]|uniref:Helix-turn-helix transcriptional regulator n=1 Tax=Aquimarina algicola TaxID=2589995 RepID=A0A504JEE1_9FLAO|nr:AraC family transcriptional regulator [Aquimarina algicola]TPN86805.1 helix-turn-helix transcriptional regulator [Aquimarina algicola]
MSIWFSIGFTVSIFSIILITRKENSLFSEKIATAILGIWTLRFVLFYVKENTDVSFFPLLYFLDQGFFFVDGPLLFLYSKSLSVNRIRCKALLHFIPAVMAFAVTIYTYFQVPKADWPRIIEQLLSQSKQNIYRVSVEESVFIYCILIHNAIYALLSLKDVKKIKKVMLSNLSTINKSGVNWLSKFVKFWMFLLLIPLTIYFFNYIYPIVNIHYLEMGLIISLVLSAIYFGTNVIEQENIRIVHQEDETKTNNLKNKLSEKQAEIFQRLLAFMEKEKPFLEVDLTLNKLANLINIKSNELSYIINKNTYGNFHDFVNQYRIESVKKELTQSNEQIIMIAYANGFNSKSTFNSVFKKKTGMTPSQYRKTYTKVR